MILKWDYRQLDISCADCAANFSPQPTEKLVFPAWFAVWLSPLSFLSTSLMGFPLFERARAENGWWQKRDFPLDFSVCYGAVYVLKIYIAHVFISGKKFSTSLLLYVKAKREREGEVGSSINSNLIAQSSFLSSQPSAAAAVVRE